MTGCIRFAIILVLLIVSPPLGIVCLLFLVISGATRKPAITKDMIKQILEENRKKEQESKSQD